MRKATGLDVAKDMAVLRSLAAETLLSLDVRRVGSIPTDVPITDICFSPDGKRLLLAEGKRGMKLSLLVFDVDTRTLLRTITYTTIAENFQRFAGNALELLKGAKQDAGKFQEWLHVITSSPDGNWLAAGTRFGSVIDSCLGGGSRKVIRY